MSTAEQKRGVRLTIALLIGIITLIVGLFVRQFLHVERLDPNWLQAHGTLIFDAPKPLPPTQLLDQHGEPFDGSGFVGHWSVLFFGYSYCPDVCPTTLATLQQSLTLMRERDQELPTVYLVSVDPARDTPAKLSGYLGFFDPDFNGLTGEFLDLHRFATALNIAFRKAPGDADNYLVDHSAQLVLLDQDGNYRGLIKPPFEARQLADTLGAVMRTY